MNSAENSYETRREANNGAMKRLVLGMLVGATLMVVAFWGVPVGAVARSLLAVKPLGLVVFTLLVGLQMLLQAVRQRVLLSDAAPPLGLGDSLGLIWVGSFAIQTFPVRLGELARPWMLSRYHQVPMGTGVAVVAIERAFDLVALLLMLAGVLLTVALPARSVDVWGASIDIVSWGWGLARVVVPLVTLGVVAVVVAGPHGLLRLQPWVDRWAERLGVAPMSARLFAFLGPFVACFRALHQPRRLLLVTVLSAMLWVEIAAMYTVLGEAFGLDLTFGHGAGVMSITALGSLLPAPPAMAGVQEAFGRGALVLLGVSSPGGDAVALGYAVAAHWWQYALTAGGALAVAAWKGVALGEVLATARATEHAKSAENP